MISNNRLTKKFDPIHHSCIYVLLTIVSLGVESFTLLKHINMFRKGKPFTEAVGWIPHQLGLKIIIRSVFDPWKIYVG
jgi:hypothetical protein